MFKVLLWDVDNTLLDFSAAERCSLRAAFSYFGFGECSDEMMKVYSNINNEYWKKLETGEMSKAEILEGRFHTFFEQYGIDCGVVPVFNRFYENGLVDTVEPIENGLDIVRSLKGKYAQYAVTNGSYEVQTKKLEKAGLNALFDGVFISDAVGADKPSKEFFGYVLEHIVPCDREEILIIGDSLTSDMRGGNNIGIKCCWYNPHGAEMPEQLRIDYEIRHLNGILQIV